MLLNISWTVRFEGNNGTEKFIKFDNKAVCSCCLSKRETCGSSRNLRFTH